MNVPFHLRRRPAGGPAVAALLPRRDPAALLGLCESLGLDPHGHAFEVAGGYLLKLAAPTARPMPGAVRLRAAAPNLFLPVDAELVPALLDDEAAGLARDRGLVFLPDGRVLGFEPGAPLAAGALLSARRLPDRDWRPLPERPVLAERIEEIVVERPDESPESLLDEGDGGSVGAEAPGTGESGPAANLLGRAAFGAGKGLARLGAALGSGALSGLGAGLAALGAGLLGGARRLGDDLIARQAAALGDLLREFREGDVESALRRALPLDDPGGSRGAGVSPRDRLAAHDLSYRLNDLLGGGSSAGHWAGGRDVVAELTREYQKAAEDALRRGDFRRAAAIYGKLLRDYRSAAYALQRGGLHHDAAVLLLVRLNDRAMAAHAFEAAGEFDRALQLYREVGLRERAGDLLRRLGEDDEALGEYRAAAEAAAGSGGHLRAGDLLRAKAGRPDLALPFYLDGWRTRPAANAVSCALQLARHHAEGADLAALHALIDEADRFFESSPPNPTDAGRFFNELAGLASLPTLEPARDDVRDRALTGLADQLRRHSRPGVTLKGLVTDLLGARDHWPAALVADAAFAVAAATRAAEGATPPAGNPAVRRFRVGVGTVTAVAYAPASDAVFLGFERGEVYCFRPERSEVVPVTAYDLPVASLATDPEGTRLVVLRSHLSGRGVLTSYEARPDGSYKVILGSTLANLSNAWLTPLLPGATGHAFGLWDGQLLHVFWAETLGSDGWVTPFGSDRNPTAALLLGSEDDADGDFSILIHDGWQWNLYDRSGNRQQRTGLTWLPSPGRESTLRSASLSRSGTPGGTLDLAGIDAEGLLHWGRLHEGNLIASNTTSTLGGYLATAIVRGDLVAGVSHSAVEWLRCGASRFTLWRTTETAVPSAVACFPGRRTRELVIVCKDGFIASVTNPTR